MLDCPGAAFGLGRQGGRRDSALRSVVLKKVSPSSEFGYANEFVCISKAGEGIVMTLVIPSR